MVSAVSDKIDVIIRSVTFVAAVYIFEGFSSKAILPEHCPKKIFSSFLWRISHQVRDCDKSDARASAHHLGRLQPHPRSLTFGKHSIKNWFHYLPHVSFNIAPLSRQRMWGSWLIFCLSGGLLVFPKIVCAVLLIYNWWSVTASEVRRVKSRWGKMRWRWLRLRLLFHTPMTT